MPESELPTLFSRDLGWPEVRRASRVSDLRPLVKVRGPLVRVRVADMVPARVDHNAVCAQKLWRRRLPGLAGAEADEPLRVTVRRPRWGGPVADHVLLEVVRHRARVIGRNGVLLLVLYGEQVPERPFRVSIESLDLLYEGRVLELRLESGLPCCGLDLLSKGDHSLERAHGRPPWARSRARRAPRLFSLTSTAAALAAVICCPARTRRSRGSDSASRAGSG